jgi:hypothetical protein
MVKQIGKLSHKRRGSVMAGDWIFVATILILGAVTGLSAMRQTRLNNLPEAVKTKTVNSSR